MTRVPTIAPPKEMPQQAGQTHVLDYELVTPMYGGGVTAHTVDEAMPIRASAIRGQLRFWWRLLAEHKWKLGDTNAIRKAEFALWGGMDEKEPQASKVLIKIVRSSNQKIVVAKWAKYDGTRLEPEDWAKVPYALFPAQGRIEYGNITEQPHKLAQAGLRWELHVRFTKNKPLDPKKPKFDPNISKIEESQVWEAIRWWSCFGGVGARTRRGLGAVHLVKTSDHVPANVLKPITVEEAEKAGCQLAHKPPVKDVYYAWKAAVEKLQTFRQIGVGRRSHSNRSVWPEPDAIRRITGQSSQRHENAVTQGNFFPRAAFGLPIIFKFKDDGKHRNDEPAQTSLQPRLIGEKKPRERMASPIILRPTPDGKGRWSATVLLLPYRDFKNVQLNLFYTDKDMQRKHPDGWDVDYLNIQLVSNIQPIADNNGTNALDAFINYFEGN